MRSDADIETAMASHGAAVLRACSAYLPRHDAEDVFQETFLRYAKRSEPFSELVVRHMASTNTRKGKRNRTRTTFVFSNSKQSLPRRSSN